MILAIDYGHKRLGIAVHSGVGEVVLPLSPVVRQNVATDIQCLSEICRAHQVNMILLGLPLHMNGDEGKACVAVRQFGKLLEEKLNLEHEVKIDYFDERLTSYEAEDILKQNSVSIKKKKLWRDSLSAAVLLKSYLSKKEINE